MIDFVIIGAERSGSTLLQQLLLAHPQVRMPKREVPCFEDPYFSEDSVKTLQRQLDLLKNASGNCVTGIKRPNYLGRAECPQRLRNYAPNAKLIALLRNPIDRAVSAYFHQMKFGFIPIRPIEQGLPDVLDGKYATRFPVSEEIINFGRYEQHLRRYQELFPDDQLIIRTNDDFSNNTTGVIADIYAALGIADIEVTHRVVHPVNEGIYSYTRLKILDIRRKRYFRYDENTGRFDLSDKAVDRLIHLVLAGFDRYVLRIILGNKKPTISPDLRKRIYAVFEDDIQFLQEEFALPVANWVLRE